MDDVDRAEDVRTAGGREQLEAFLHDLRVDIGGLLDGLTEEQARRRLVPSRTTLLGLVKHAAFVERVWFDVAFSGRPRAEVGIPDAAEDSFELDDDDSVATVTELYRRAWETSVRVAAEHEPDDVALHNRRSPVSLRWISLHLVRELARHAGHGDILREQILAAPDPGDSRAGTLTSSRPFDEIKERSSAAGPALHHVQVACPPGGEDDARRFYGDGLGLTEVDKPEDLRRKGGAWFRGFDDQGAVTAEIHVGVEEPFSPARKAHPALRFSSVAELEAVAARLGGLGFGVDWTQRHSFPGHERCHTADAVGNRVELLAPPGSRPGPRPLDAERAGPLSA